MHMDGHDEFEVVEAFFGDPCIAGNTRNIDDAVDTACGFEDGRDRFLDL